MSDDIQPLSPQELDDIEARPEHHDSITFEEKRWLKTVRDRERRCETHEAILARCALALNCEPRQVYDRLLERLKRNVAKTETPAS